VTQQPPSAEVIQAIRQALERAVARQVEEYREAFRERVAVIERALAEDRAADDVTSQLLVPEQARGRAVIRAKQAGVVAGVQHGCYVLALCAGRGDLQVLAEEGARVTAGAELVRIEGRLRGLLAGERTAINLIQRMSGIATLTAQFVDAVTGTRAKVLATRKTAPGLRAFDLEAVRAGGGDVHRASLAERVLVKENHLAAARAAGTARTMADVVALLARERPGVPVGVEAEDLDELRAALVAGVEVVLLDDFSSERVAEAVALRDAAFPQGGGPALEVSGGVTLASVRRYAETGVERISVGAITHSAPALDVSMKVLPA
jgi:nicotinate-nucleotide pyrophosphorylase (carboxylating)